MKETPLPEPSEELITRWIDGDLSGNELANFEQSIASEREIYDAMRAEAQDVALLLKANFASSQEPPYPDFFNSQIQKHIRDNMGAEAAVESKTSLKSQIWSWFSSPFTLAAAAAVALLIVAIRPASSGEGSTLVSSLYSPNPDVAASSYYSKDADATVIVLDGLESIPDEREIRGKDIATYAPSATPGFGKFYDTNHQLAFVMETNAQGAPLFFSMEVDG